MIDIAKERMDILFSLAEKEFARNPQRSNRYVFLAKKLSTKYNTAIPFKWSRRYCKNCNKFLVTGKNSNVRLISSEVHIKCCECNFIMKIPFIKEKKLKRRAKIESYIIQKRAHE